MPCLIPEMLFAVGKKLVQDRDADAMIRFTVSGKESLKAMKNVFASVTSLGLYRDGYAIEWNNRSTKFKLQNGKPFCKFLMDQIGSCVEAVHLDIDGINRMYQTVLDKIIANQRLITLYVGSQCSRFLLDKFFLAVSSSLKNVTTPSSKMHNVFRDYLNLDSLVVLESNGYDYLSFLCKTESLELWHFHDNKFITDYNLRILDLMPPVGPMSPHLSTVKKLTFNSKTFNLLPNVVFYAIKNHFPALEVIQYNQELYHADFESPEEVIFYLVKYLEKIIVMDAAALPQKYVCKFIKCNENIEFPSFEWCEDLFNSDDYFDGTGYYDESNQKFNDDEMKDFHCFRLNIPSDFDESRTTIMEIQVAK